MMILIIATRNSHKVQEIQNILANGFTCAGIDKFPDSPLITEDADSFAGNATKKAVKVGSWIKQRFQNPISRPQLVLADDSGLEVDALNGGPGLPSRPRGGRRRGPPGDSFAPQ